MKELNGSSFGSLLRFFRHREPPKTRLSQRELAKKLEVHVNSVSLWERDLELPESHLVVAKIAEFLNLNEEDTRLLFEARYGTASILPLYNVPFERNPYFTDQETVLQHLHNQLATGKKVALKQAISGIGGVGKTQIALEYIYRYRGSYHDVLWIAAESFETFTSSYVELAKLLHLREKDLQDQNLIVGAVKRWLSTHEGWLLILDNVEDFSLVNTFIPPGRQGSILLTTQRQVTAPVAQPSEIECMAEEEGALFLLRRTHYMKLDEFLQKMPTDDNITNSAKIISRELGGLPLALDQAGAYILETGCSLSDYLALYTRRRTDLLKRRGSIPIDHPASVTMTFSLALERVTQKHPAALELLCFFAFLAPDAIPEELIIKGRQHLGPLLQSICADDFEFNTIIDVLRIFSLIHRNRGKMILNIHRVVQVVILDTMEEQITQLWADRTIKAVNEAFPGGEFDTWEMCERCLPHVLICADKMKLANMVSPEGAQLLNRTGYYLMGRSQYALAEQVYQQVLEMNSHLLGTEHPEIAVSLNNLASSYDAEGKYTEAEALYHQALVIYEQLGNIHLEVTVVLNNLAELYSRQSKYREAEALFHRALKINEQLPGGEHFDVARVLNNLANLYFIESKYNEAEALYQRVLGIAQRTFGPEHPDVATISHNLANVYQKQGKYNEAEALFEQVLIAKEQLLGAEHSRLGTSMNELANVYQRQGKYNEAEALYRRALMIAEKNFGSEHPDVARSLDNLANIYRSQGEYTKAEPLFRKSLEINEKVLGTGHTDVAITLNNLALLYQGQGRCTEAKSLYQRAIAILDQQLGSHHPTTMLARENASSLLN